MYNNLILGVHGEADNRDLDRIENEFHIKIPETIREHFLTYNGGYPEKPVFVCENGETYIVDYFMTIKDREEGLEKSIRLLRDDEIMPGWLIPFAYEDGGNLFCFSVRESDYGSIYYYDHEFEYGANPEEHVTYLAESIIVFMNSLVEDEDDEGEDEENGQH